ncbi:squamous cell carcinoma antigen recognized by T-cells 3, partial [Lecanoromycetidae sp. Uapishka_2]
MDINSLLSPQEPPRENPPSTPLAKAPAKRPRKPRTTKVTQPSPLANTTLPPPDFPHNAVVQAQQYAVPAPQNVSPGGRPRLSSMSSITPPAEGPHSNRQPSTAGMDTLAELASMQHHQQIARANAVGLRSDAIYDKPPTSASALPNILSISRTQSLGELRDPSQLRAGSMDIAMMDGPVETPPRRLSTGALSETELQTVTQLIGYLATNPFAYESHIQLINLLHHGFLNHVQPTSSQPGDPHTYDLLTDLQNARDTMDSRFALGEDLWADWMQDRILLANSLEDMVDVMELCQRAVLEEPRSMKLWLVYGNYMLSLYRCASANSHMDQRLSGIGNPPKLRALTEEEILIAREVFTWQRMLNVWDRGVQETQWRLNDSHMIWDTYTEILLQALAVSQSQAAMEDLQTRFVNRLQIPHATWDQTFQSYSTFISRYKDSSYENAMIAANQLSAEAKTKYGNRETMEIGLLRAQERNDTQTELKTFCDYIQWELDQSHKKKAFDFKLANTLYERATLRFPTNTEFWEGHAMLVTEEVTHHPHQDLTTLPVLAKATRHCPWSGNLWFQYLLAAENNKLSYEDIENMKHKATSTGVLDAGGMEEVLKVLTAWCGFLRRRAFHETSTDEELDVAEVGIRSAIEDMETLGRQKYGKGYQGDPQFRLEKIYIKFLTQCHNFDGARQNYKDLVPKRGDSHDFWIRYYLWEMNTWSKLAYNENGNGYIKPTEPTKVLHQAMKRQKMDWPEIIIELYQYHCEDHEDVEELQSSLSFIWKAKRSVLKRREKEANEAYAAAQAQAYQQQQQAQQDVANVNGDSDNAGKRKREDEPEEGWSTKKPRPGVVEQDEAQLEEQSIPDGSQLKRDRENATIVVKNLPVDTKDIRVRQYFRDCGTINALKILPEPDGESVTAYIEFDSKDDVATAQTKDTKAFDGRAISVQVGSGSTLRFCYLQYKTSSQAHAATELDGEECGENLKLDVKISDPAHKKPREGAIHEGRELFLANLDWNVDRADVKKAFSKYGKVESVRIPTKANGTSKGIGFVDEATAALEMNLVQFKRRILNVSVSTDDKTARQTTQIITSRGASQSATASPTPDHHLSQANGDTHNAASSTPPADSLSKSSEIQSRTLALMNIPDTVNDARIRALAEPYGDLVLVKLRPSHQGAILEYKDRTSVGKAGLGLEGYEIAPGRFISTGTVAQMNHNKAEYRSDKIAVGTAKSTNAALQGSVPLRRPAQPGARGRGKGGLGMKRGVVGLRGATAKGDDQEKDVDVNGTGTVTEDGDTEGVQGKAKSNADFKAMFFRKEGS